MEQKHVAGCGPCARAYQSPGQPRVSVSKLYFLDVLARAISELRKIFNDNPQTPGVIETIPETGYRLIARVSRISNRN